MELMIMGTLACLAPISRAKRSCGCSRAVLSSHLSCLLFFSLFGLTHPTKVVNRPIGILFLTREREKRTLLTWLAFGQQRHANDTAFFFPCGVRVRSVFPHGKR